MSPITELSVLFVVVGPTVIHPRFVFDHIEVRTIALMSPSPVLRSASPTTPSGPEPKLSSKNPISVRLYTFLGTNFDDHATEALQTLSDLYVTPPSASKEPVPAGLEEGSHKDLRPDASPISAPGLGPVLEESVPGESAARARRNLRRDMETKLTNASKQFLEAFGEVDQVCGFSTRLCLLWGPIMH